MAESPINRSAKTVISRTLLLDDTIIYLFIYSFICLFTYLFIYLFLLRIYVYVYKCCEKCNFVKNLQYNKFKNITQCI